MEDLTIYAQFITIQHYTQRILSLNTQAAILKDLIPEQLPIIPDDVLRFLAPMNKPSNGAICRELRRIGVQPTTIAQITGIAKSSVSQHLANKKANDVFTHKFLHELRNYVYNQREQINF